MFLKHLLRIAKAVSVRLQHSSLFSILSHSLIRLDQIDWQVLVFQLQKLERCDRLSLHYFHNFHYEHGWCC